MRQSRVAMAVAGAALLVASAAGCSDGGATPAPSTTLLSSPAGAIRIEAADGCPATVDGFDPHDGSTGAPWIFNPDTTGLEDQFVPGTPTSALVCRFAALDAVTLLADGTTVGSGELFSSTELDGPGAATLADSLNEIEPSTIASGCVPPADKTRYTAIVFSVPGRSDINLWLKDWMRCPSVGNGSLSSGLLINGHGAGFLRALDAAAPPAPAQD